MRLIGKLPTPELAQHFSRYLVTQKIDNQCDGDEIWIINDDHLEPAEVLMKQFLQNPADPQFAGIFEPPPQQAAPPSRRWGNLTVITIAICAILFVWAGFEAFRTKSKLGVIDTPIYAALMYDYPEAIAEQAKILREVSPEELENPSPELRKRLEALKNASFFQGAYGEIIDLIKNGNDETGPLFTQIREGEVWRLFTPALLHGNLLHIFFNVIWLVVLGNQVEHRTGWLRYLILMLVIGVISNTAQYLMGGPLFLGLSGIVCGLLGFIWMRQKRAPWEGYLLSRTTIIFLSVFILGMAGLQTVSFFLEIAGKKPIGVGIANTAHISGVFIGLILGRFNLFSLQEKSHVSA